jgi:hypothetical protein
MEPVMQNRLIGLSISEFPSKFKIIFLLVGAKEKGVDSDL